MNERIRELYEQAHEQKPVIVADPVTFEPIHKIGNYNKPMYHNVFNPEKFAELLIRECLGVVESNIYGPHGEYDYSYSDADAAADSRAQSIHDDIKYHFGVLE